MKEHVTKAHRSKLLKRWDTICSCCTAGASVVCMSSMGAAVAASGAAASAGMAGMAGLASVGVAHTSASGALALTRFFEAVGLGVLNKLPNEVAQPLLVTLLVTSLGAAYIAYRGHCRPGAPLLSLASAIAMYVSIYVWMSEPLYFVSLAGLLGAGIWGIFLARTRQPATSTSTMREDMAEPG